MFDCFQLIADWDFAINKHVEKQDTELAAADNEDGLLRANAGGWFTGAAPASEKVSSGPVKQNEDADGCSGTTKVDRASKQTPNSGMWPYATMNMARGSMIVALQEPPGFQLSL